MKKWGRISFPAFFLLLYSFKKLSKNYPFILLGVLFPVRGNPSFAPGSPSRCCCWLPGLSGPCFRSCRGLSGWSGCYFRNCGGLPGRSGCHFRSCGWLPEQSGCHFLNCRELYIKSLCNLSKIQALSNCQEISFCFIMRLILVILR